MSKTSTRAQRARNAANAAGHNPYLRRIIEDEDLRASAAAAFEAARDAYARLSANGHPIDTAIDDKRLHGDLKSAAENLREATHRLKGEEEKRSLGRLLLVGLVAAVLAVIIFSEDLRKSILDAIFGAEEEFEYTSTTAAPAAAPAASE